MYHLFLFLIRCYTVRINGQYFLWVYYGYDFYNYFLWFTVFCFCSSRCPHYRLYYGFTREGQKSPHRKTKTLKRIISITITLCLVFASVLPVYAAWGDSTSDRQNLTSIKNDVNSLITAFTGSVGTMYNSVSELMSWLTPVGSFSSSHSITGVTLYEIVDYIAWTLSGVGPTVYQTFQDIATSITNTESFISSWMSSNNTNLSQLVGSAPLNSGNGLLRALTNYFYIRNGFSNTISEIYQSAHRGLGFQLDTDSGLYNLSYNINYVNSDGTISTYSANWNNGTPIGNIALILQKGLLSLSNLGNGILLNAKDNLTTWEHSTNTQTAFTPTSLANGLFRYLAYIQSDTAALWYNGLRNYDTQTNLRTVGYNLGPRTPVNNNVIASSFADLARRYFSADTLNSSYTYQHLFRMRNNAGNSDTYLGVMWGWDPQTLTRSSVQSVTSLTDLVASGFEFLSKGTSRLAYVLANDEEIAARAAAKDDQNAVINNFVASSGNASASPTDYATVSAASSDFQNNFDTGVSASGVWTAFSNNYEWFTQTTADNLDTTQNNTRSASYETPYLDNYYSEVMGFFEDKRSDIKESPDFVSNYIEQFNAERAEPVEDEQR